MREYVILACILALTIFSGGKYLQEKISSAAENILPTVEAQEAIPMFGTGP